jgi:hypothetical protein
MNNRHQLVVALGASALAGPGCFAQIVARRKARTHALGVLRPLVQWPKRMRLQLSLSGRTREFIACHVFRD